MSSKRQHRLRGTLAFSLSLWYAGVFTLSSFVAFLAFYLLMKSDIQDRTHREFLNEFQEYSSLLSIKGFDTLKTVMALEAESEGIGKIFFRIVTPEGHVLASSNLSSWGDIGVGRVALKRLAGGVDHVFETLEHPGEQGTTLILYGTLAPGKILQMGQSLAENKRFMRAFRGIFIKLQLFLMVVAGLIGWFMAKRALSGVEEVTRTAREISKGALERRVPLKTRGEEIDRLAVTFNSMLDRIDALMKGMREVTDDIAHDLRSPITRIRGIAEMTLTTGHSVEEYQTLAATTIEECDRLLEVVNTMLDISEVEAGAGVLKIEKLDLAGVVRDACALFQPIAEDKGIRINAEIPDFCLMRGDIRKLQRLVANLLDNALKYTPLEGVVEVFLNGDDERVILSVRDKGIGIPPEDLPHIFERFYRCDQSRSEPGVGLGLSLALAIARAHGGEIKVKSASGEGSVFSIHLPRSPLTP